MPQTFTRERIHLVNGGIILPKLMQATKQTTNYTAAHSHTNVLKHVGKKDQSADLVSPDCLPMKH